MKKLTINPGDKFGKLTYIKDAEPIRMPSGQTNRAVLCQCDCGVKKVVRVMHLVRMRTITCGTCSIYANHGGTGTQLHNSWRGMKNRVGSNYFQKQYYADKGITICEEWKSFPNFRDWALKNGYREGLEIDRKKNDQGYNPKNCRWVTGKVNQNNKDESIFIKYHGRKVALKLLIEELGIAQIHYYAIRTRLKRGWNETEAIDTPIRKGNYKTAAK